MIKIDMNKQKYCEDCNFYESLSGDYPTEYFCDADTNYIRYDDSITMHKNCPLIECEEE